MPWSAFLVSLLLLAAQAPPDDSWPRYGHDGALTGRSPLRGRMAKPRLAWSFPAAGREVLLEVVPAEGERRLELRAGQAPPSALERRAPRPGPRSLDLDGTGTPRAAVETHHERWGKLLPGVRGLQKVSWSHTWTDQKVCRLRLFAHDEGLERPRLVWETDPPEDTVFNPLNVVSDIDGDGVQEVCVAAHYRLMVFEGTTGRKETELRYHGSRPYGWFGLADVDADGQDEMVTIGDFQSHVDVLELDRSKPEAERLSVKWRRDIESRIEERTKWPQVGPRPLADVTGEAPRRPEILLSLFNDAGDGQWHAVVLDAATGSVVCDLPRRTFQGAADLDGDGAEEVFLAETSGVLVPAFGRAEVVSLRDGRPRTILSREGAAWGAADLPYLGPTWSTTASQGMRHVLVAEGPGNPAFLLLERPLAPARPSAIELSAVRLDPVGELAVLWRIEGWPDGLEVLAFSKIEGSLEHAPGALVRVRLSAGEVPALAARGAEARPVEERALGVAPSPPVAARLRPGGPVTVAAEGPAGRILVLEPPREAGASPRLLWQRPGRGMADGNRRLGLLAADLDGDGGAEVVAAGATPAGEAVLTAFRGNGSPLWERRFAETPGGDPAWNQGALTFWWPGRFRSPDRTDLFVNTRRGPMHSDVGHLVDGASGSIVWSQERAEVPGEFRWGYGGSAPAVADVDGGGLEEIVSLHPVCFWIADGRTGRIATGRELASQKRLPAWAAYGEPLVFPFGAASGEPGAKQVLLDSPYILALLDAAGNPLWHGRGRASYPTSAKEGNAGETTATRHALADLDGDGTFEVCSAGYGDGFRAIDPRSGKVLWSLETPRPTGSRVVAGDLDGRGGDEVLYPSGDSLVCVAGDRTAGRVLWVWQGPAALSMPAIADLDADGEAEVALQAADGSVLCLDGEE
ncbi:MAG: hypothetical protein HY721_01110 [Planctomycetes bacterium]|nr:hypothetical protein [Planctomycetota bacterium]